MTKGQVRALLIESLKTQYNYSDKEVEAYIRGYEDYKKYVENTIDLSISDLTCKEHFNITMEDNDHVEASTTI